MASCFHEDPDIVLDKWSRPSLELNSFQRPCLSKIWVKRILKVESLSSLQSGLMQCYNCILPLSRVFTCEGFRDGLQHWLEVCFCSTVQWELSSSHIEALLTVSLCKLWKAKFLFICMLWRQDRLHICKQWDASSEVHVWLVVNSDHWILYCSQCITYELTSKVPLQY